MLRRELPGHEPEPRNLAEHCRHAEPVPEEQVGRRDVQQVCVSRRAHVREVRRILQGKVGDNCEGRRDKPEEAKRSLLHGSKNLTSRLSQPCRIASLHVRVWDKVTAQASTGEARKWTGKRSAVCSNSRALFGVRCIAWLDVW